MRTEKVLAERGNASAPGGPVSGEPTGERPGSPIEPSRRAVASVAAFALLVAASYFPALSGGLRLGRRDLLQGAGHPSMVRPVEHLVLAGRHQERRPLLADRLYPFWLEHKLWGLAPFGYHLVNLVLHLVNALLVWRVALRLAVPGAWALAAVFAVHPLHVESVAWVIERKDLLCALFYLSAVLAWIRFTGTPRPARYCLMLGLFAAALLSKSVAVTLPAVLVVWHWWKRGTVTAADWLRLAPLFACGLAVTAADFAFYTLARAALAPLLGGWSGC